ncbi:MAG: hypothetical protein AVDCRST_MAG50-2595 [uncultured Acidimicrobiales bacterium]|uniref:Glyoxalase-like domain-containing protein n=1 Tax=uncultured Acidimicrobiales bacterium TaxID=310071 RepID=A0A6J4IP28_9ACTN|nr:MAG: hypothetical protein AVDCRST_MAG50-2595 [uncultured Acidimicrobiales bacterium]
MKLAEIVFDCEHPARLARFWVAVLDGFEVRAYDEAEIARLAGLGLTPETDPVVMVDGPGLHLCFQKTDTRAGPKNKVHLDVSASDRPAEVDRVRALGATVVAELASSTWLHDPEGNDFCITDPR